MNQLPRHLFAKSRKNVCQDGKIIEPKLDDTQCGCCRGSSTTEQISTLQQIFEKSWKHAKHLYTCFVDLGKYKAGFLMNNFGGCWGSTVLTGASCWPSNNCIPLQRIVSVSTELTHNRSALDSDNSVCCHLLSSPQHETSSWLPPSINPRLTSPLTRFNKTTGTFCFTLTQEFT